jgi:hypothetical protein
MLNKLMVISFLLILPCPFAIAASGDYAISGGGGVDGDHINFDFFGYYYTSDTAFKGERQQFSLGASIYNEKWSKQETNVDFGTGSGNWTNLVGGKSPHFSTIMSAWSNKSPNSTYERVLKMYSAGSLASRWNAWGGFSNLVSAGVNVQNFCNYIDGLGVDSDGDGFTNQEEIAAGTDPHNKNKNPDHPNGIDSDFDGISDEQEEEDETDPSDPDDYKEEENSFDFGGYPDQIKQLINDKFNFELDSLSGQQGIDISMDIPITLEGETRHFTVNTSLSNDPVVGEWCSNIRSMLSFFCLFCGSFWLFRKIKEDIKRL